METRIQCDQLAKVYQTVFKVAMQQPSMYVLTLLRIVIKYHELFKVVF